MRALCSTVCVVAWIVAAQCSSDNEINGETEDMRFSILQQKHAEAALQGVSPALPGFNASMSRPTKPYRCRRLEDHHTVEHGIVFGDISTERNSDVECLYSNISEIYGNLEVSHAPKLTRLELPALTKIWGSLVIINCGALKQVSMDSLTSVGENLVLQRNQELSALTLPNLRNVSRSISLSANYGLIYVSLPRLIGIGLHFLMESNPKMRKLEAHLLAEIRWDLVVSGNSELNDISFESLVLIGEDLEIHDCAWVETLHLPRLKRVHEDLEVYRMKSLHSLLLPALSFIGEDLQIHDSQSLASISFPLLTHVDEDLEIHNLPVCESISLPALERVNEDVIFFQLDSLKQLAMDSLADVQEDVDISSNEMLSELSMSALEQIAGSLHLAGLPDLANLSFPVLKVIGDFRVYPEQPDWDDHKSHKRGTSCHYGVGDCHNSSWSHGKNEAYIADTGISVLKLPKLELLVVKAFIVIMNANLETLQLPRLTSFGKDSFTIDDLNDTFAVAKNPQLRELHVGLGCNLPRQFSVEGNAQTFSCTGPHWCNAVGISLDVAERVLDHCDGLSDMDEKPQWLRQHCFQFVCPAEAIPKAALKDARDSSGCLVLSALYDTATGMINGSVVLRADAAFHCIVAGAGLAIINECFHITAGSGVARVDLAEVTEIRGNTEIRGSGILAINAPFLASVSWDFSIVANSGLEKLLLRSLATVGGMLQVSHNGALTRLELPSLRYAHAWLVIHSNAALEYVSLPRLAEIGLDPIFGVNERVQSLELPVLVSVGEDVEVYRNSFLSQISMPRLSKVMEDFEVYLNDCLARLEVNALEYVGEDFEVYSNRGLRSTSFRSLRHVNEDLEIFDNPLLHELDDGSFPALISSGEDVEIYVCHSLEYVYFPQLRVIAEDFLLFGNPVLKDVSLPKLSEIAYEQGGGMLVTDNMKLSSISLPSLRRIGNHTEDRDATDGRRDIVLYTGISEYELPDAYPRLALLAHNPRLKSVELPQLEAMYTGLWVTDHDALTHFDTSRLQTLESRPGGYWELPDSWGGAYFVMRWNPHLSSLKLNAFLVRAPSYVNLGCNSKDFCVSQDAPVWAQPRCPPLDEEYCPDTSWDQVPCGDDSLKCTDMFYDWARNDAYDFEENILQWWLPARFSSFRQASKLGAPS